VRGGPGATDVIYARDTWKSAGKSPCQPSLAPVFSDHGH
jgi:hypothetical protein